MAKITVVVTSRDNTEGLRYSLESLCEQSDEEFDVLVVQRGKVEGNLALIREYCDEYVGFSYLTGPEGCSVPAARNLGAAQAAGELLLFMNEGDYLAPESIEAFKKAYEDTKADILCPRLYISGENEPYYLDWADMLATVPHIGRFDEALLHTLDAEGRVFKKRFFDLYSLRFPDQPVFYNTAFLTECVYKCDASLTGVAGAVYDTHAGVFMRGFPEGSAPCGENLKLACRLYDSVVQVVKTYIEEETGGFTGDEYTYQEILFVYFKMLTDRFYRFFWFLTDEDIAFLRDKYEALSAEMTESRREKLKTAFADLRFPAMYVTRADAAAVPMVSLLIDFPDVQGLPALLRSLYLGRLPFFEVFVRESMRAGVPEAFINHENMHILPDAGFFAAARGKAAGVPINVRSAEPLDPKVLSELSVTKAPVSFYQYLFASKRKKYSAKTFLKKKGMSLR
jgi:glycosyltransferase involved in cell wall biosynthesis